MERNKIRPNPFIPPKAVFREVEGAERGCGRRKRGTGSGGRGGKRAEKKNSPELLAYRFRTVWDMGKNMFSEERIRCAAPW